MSFIVQKLRSNGLNARLPSNTLKRHRLLSCSGEKLKNLSHFKKTKGKKYTRDWLNSVRLLDYCLLGSCEPSDIGSANICGGFETEYDEYSTSENGVPLSGSMSVNASSIDDRYVDVAIHIEASSGNETATLDPEVSLYYGPSQINDTPSFLGCDEPNTAENYSFPLQANRPRVEIKFFLILGLWDFDYMALGADVSVELNDSQDERIAGYGFQLAVPVSGFWACS